jgi:Mce-associated membrane protein
MPRPLPRALRAAGDRDGAQRETAAPASRPSPRPRPRPHPVEPVPEPAFESTAGETPAGRALPAVLSSRPLVAGLGVLVVLLAVAVSVLGFHSWRAAATAQAAEDALAAAQTSATTLFSYDYRTIDASLAAGKKVVTGQLATDYASTSAIVGPTAVKNQAVVKATVSEAAVVSADPDRVVVLVYLNQSTQSKNTEGTQLDMNRVRLTMVRAGDDWRITRAEPL